MRARVEINGENATKRWISGFNERGIDGLIERGEAGRPRKIERKRFEEEIVPLILQPLIP